MIVVVAPGAGPGVTGLLFLESTASHHRMAKTPADGVPGYSAALVTLSLFTTTKAEKK